MQKVRSKAELMRQIKRFFKDEDRGISIALFAEVCGLSVDLLRSVFIDETQPMTERTQIRVDRALSHYIAGDIAVMRHRYYKTKRVVYREEPKPVAKRNFQLTVSGGEIKLKVGLKAKGDYTDPHLDELLK